MSKSPEGLSRHLQAGEPGNLLDVNSLCLRREIPLTRAFTLFHASQIDGIPAHVSPTIAEAPWRAPEAAEIVLANSGAVVLIGGDRAFYSPATDHIQMPSQAAFATVMGYSEQCDQPQRGGTASPHRRQQGKSSISAAFAALLITPYWLRVFLRAYSSARP